MHAPTAIDSPLLAAARVSLLRHPLRQALTTPTAWRIFMSHHIFAVWDFMTLVKRLQRELTCTALPWLPPADPQASRFINSVVLAEESDEDGAGGISSHFGLYLGAMQESSADPAPARAFIAQLRAGRPVAAALAQAGAPAAAARFVGATLRLAEHGRLEEVCAAFFWGREEIIPDMFAGLLQSLAASGHEAPRLRAYMDRHVSLDADEHGPMARQMMARLCADHPGAAGRAEAAATAALSERHHLWDAIHAAIIGASGQAPWATPQPLGARGVA